MKNKSVVFTAICLLIAFIWGFISRKKKKAAVEAYVQQYPTPAFGETVCDNVAVTERTVVAETFEEEEEEEARSADSPFFEEAIELAVNENPELAKDFHFEEEEVNDINSSLHPVVRIIPCNRGNVRTKRLDILFPIPLSFYMKKNHLNMGLYYEATGNKVLPGHDVNLDANSSSRIFYEAFGVHHVDMMKTDKEKSYEVKLGYFTRFLWELIDPYPKTDVEVKKEGYFNVSYLVLDPFLRKYVRRHKYVNVTHSNAVKNLGRKSGELEKFLTEAYEKYALCGKDSTLVEIPVDLVDPTKLDRRDATVAKKETEVDDVILAYRVSFFLYEEDYTKGITPEGLSRILDWLLTDAAISEKYDDPEEKTYKFLKPWIIEEYPAKRGELNVLSLNDTGDGEFEFVSIPIVPRTHDLIIEGMVNEEYLGEQE